MIICVDVINFHYKHETLKCSCRQNVVHDSTVLRVVNCKVAMIWAQAAYAISLQYQNKFYA